MAIGDELFAARQKASDDKLAYYLDLWAELMREGSGPSGYAERATGAGSTGSRDFESMCHAMDRDQAKVVDAAIGDLPLNEQVAVHHVKLGSVWRLREPIESAFERACMRLKVSLPRRGLPWVDD